MKRESIYLKIYLNLLEMDYYWFGYSTDITNFIVEYGYANKKKIK